MDRTRSVRLGCDARRLGHRPEPLILFTAFLGDRDPRLRDEATDWCIRNWRHVSKARLKNLARRQSDDEQQSFGEFAATVGDHAGTDWPGATNARAFTVTGRSTLLRLERAGVLSVRTLGNRFSFTLAKASELEEFVGDLPDVRPDWTAMLNIARELVTAEEHMGSATLRTAGVRARSTLTRIEDDLADLDIDAPSTDLTGEDLWPALRSLDNNTLGAWSIGRWEQTSTLGAPPKTTKPPPWPGFRTGALGGT